MKKNKKILLRLAIAGMAVIFIVMVTMSLLYVHQTTEVLNRRFEEEVNRSLAATAKSVEEQDIINQIQQIANDSTELSAYAASFLNSVDTADLSTTIYGRSIGKPTGIYGLTAHQTEKAERKLDLNRALVIEVMVRKNNASYLPILDRVDTAFLRETLVSEFNTSGITSNFSLALVRFSGKREIHYLSDDEFELEGDDVYRQMIFRREVTNRPYYIVVHLHDKSSYVKRYMWLVLPILGSMTILMILVVVTLMFLIQNQRLSEIQNAFIKNMTHELKTPVASISLAAEMMADTSITLPAESYAAKAKTIKSEAGRLTQIIERVLQTSVLEEGGNSYKTEEIDVHRLIQESRDAFQLKVQQCGGKIILDLNAAKHIIYGDLMHITNVGFNLMENAVKYSDHTRPLIINITTRNVGNKISIEINDNGIGIEDRYLKHIFDRFYRVPTQGDHHDVKGFGLGLSYVKEVVSKNGGTITVQSEPSVGTRFIISFDAF